MSQWGREIQIDNARFVAHVDGEAFAEVTRESMVITVMLVDDGGHRERAERLLAHLKREHEGRPYGAWLDLEVSRENERSE